MARRSGTWAKFSILCATKPFLKKMAGLILSKKKYAKQIDQSVFPGLQGGPHMHTIAAIAVALGKALQPEFKEYAKQILINAKTLAQVFLDNNIKLITNGTDNHMLVVDTIKSFNLNGTDAEKTLDKISITVNKQIIPDDPNPPLTPSGIRLGTPAATTRGMQAAEMKKIGRWIIDGLKNYADEPKLAQIKSAVEAMCSRFPVPGI